LNFIHDTITILILTTFVNNLTYAFQQDKVLSNSYNFLVRIRWLSKTLGLLIERWFSMWHVTWK